MDIVRVASAPPPPEQPEPPDEEEPPPPTDTTPPGIFGSGTDKQSMCASDTVTSNVVAGDEGGIQKVYTNWNIVNFDGDEVESGYVEYSPIPSMEYGYTAVLGTFTYSGTLNINGTVMDNAGNTASFSNTVTIDCS
jgi:hypothetical protein